MTIGPTIQHDDAVRLLKRMREGRDPLDLASHITIREDDDPAEEVVHTARRMLSGAIPVPSDAEVMLIDPVTAHLLAWQGADPLAIAALCHAANGIGVVDRHEDKIAVLMRNAPLRLVYADPLRWESIPGHLRMAPLPDTVVASLAGRRLADVLSHPALDRTPIDINRAFIDDEDRLTLHLHPRDPDILFGRERLAEVGRMYRQG
jgi:hypothetical protein